MYSIISTAINPDNGTMLIVAIILLVASIIYLISKALLYGLSSYLIYDEENSSWAKKELMMHIINKSGYSLTKNTMLSEKKFNLFCINLKAGDNIG